MQPEQLRKRLEKKAKKGLRGYPIAGAGAGPSVLFFLVPWCLGVLVVTFPSRGVAPPLLGDTSASTPARAGFERRS